VATVLHHIGVYNFQYGFLFLLPILPALPAIRRSRRILLWYLLLLFPFVWIASLYVSVGRPLPYNKHGDIFINFGLGPATLRDTWIFGYWYPFHLPRSVLALITFVSAVGGAWLLLLLVRAVRLPQNSPRAVSTSLAAIHALVATALLFSSAIYFDRYSLDSLWAVIIFAAASSSWSTGVALRVTTLLLAVGLFSVFATQEYLRWNRARWLAFDYLRARGVPLTQMDGGYEINQYLLGGWDGPERLAKRGMSVVDDTYILAFHPVARYVVLARFPFRGFLGLRRGYVYAEERVAGVGPRRSGFKPVQRR
jgi:hypothetical protein